MEETNMKKKITNYEAPQLTVVEFRMERGYAESAYTIHGAAQQINMFLAEQEMIAANDGANGNLVGGYMTETEDHSNPIGGSGWEYENGGHF